MRLIHNQDQIGKLRKADSPVQLKTLVLDDDELDKKTVTIVSQSRLAISLGMQPQQPTSTTVVAVRGQSIFTKPEDQKVAQITYDVIRKLENQPQKLPSMSHLTKP